MALQLSADVRNALPLLRVLTLGDGNFSFSAAVASAHDGKRLRSKPAKNATLPAADAGVGSAPVSSSSTGPTASAPAPSPVAPWLPSHRLCLSASSYDSASSLHAKYPEAQKLLEKVLGSKRATTAGGAQLRTVMHDVDATNLERTLLPKLMEEGPPGADADADPAAVAASPAAAVDGSIASSPAGAFSSSVFVPPSLQFDVIIFNHPHSGVEDLSVHSSLLAHFFHSANFFLRDTTTNANANVDATTADAGVAAAAVSIPKPQVHVTLCQRQPEEWQLLQHAWDKGFELVSRSEFLESHYPGYETKRHHVNKTFAKRSVQRMELFIFQRRRRDQSAQEQQRRRPEEPLYTRAEQDPSFAHNLMSHVIPMPAFKPTLPYEQAIAAINAAAAATADPAAAAAAAAVGAGAASVAPSLRTDITCDVCHKGFSSERGLHYHKENVHSGAAQGAGAGAGAVAPEQNQSPLLCNQCDPPRSFKEQAALTQHVLARHSNDAAAPAAAVAATLTPTTSSASSPSAAADTGSSASIDESLQLPCPICPLRFASAQLLEAHLSGVKPVAAAQLECLTCGRLFSNQRALVQHERAASLAPEKHVRIVVADMAGLASTSLSQGGGPSGSGTGAGAGAGAGQARSKMKRLRGMAANPDNKQSVVQRLRVKKVDSDATSAAPDAIAAPNDDDASTTAAVLSAPSATAAAATVAADNLSTPIAALLIAPPCTPFPGLDEELEGSARDLVGCTARVRVVRAVDLRVRGGMPHTLQAAFIVRMLEPPAAAEEEEEERKLDAAPRDVCVGVCLPAGYALLQAHGTPLEDGAPSPVEVSFASPLLLRDALHTLLMSASPVYAAWKADELNRKLMELFQQQATGNGDDDDDDNDQ